MKKIVGLILALALCLSTAVPAFAEVDWQTPPFGVYVTPDMYPNTDLSKPYEVNIYSTSTASEDENMVLQAFNQELAKRGFNTTIKISHIVSAGGVNTYSLALASGENIDIIYTAPWLYLWEEAAKGSFMALNEQPDWVEKYMPLTYKSQPAESWSEVTTNGQIIAIPSKNMNSNTKYPIVRQDLMEKYGFTELKNWDDWKKFALTIAEKETPISGIFAINASQDNKEVWSTYLQQENRYPIAGELFHYVYKDGNLPDFKDIHVYYESELFRKFAHEMKELSDAGCWSRTAITNTILVPDAFANLTSASYFHNGTVFTYGQLAEKNPGVKTAAYDLFPEAITVPEAYSNNNLAIPASSGNPERAAMIIDLIKNDFQFNNLFSNGIEGVHYTHNSDDNTYTFVPEKQGKFSFGDVSWAVYRPFPYLEKVHDTRRQDMTAAQNLRMKANPTVSFVFDDTNVKSELAAIYALVAESRPVLELGMVDDVDSYLDSFIDRMYKSGLQNVYNELELQYNAWKATRSEGAPASAPSSETSSQASPESKPQSSSGSAASTPAASSGSGWIILVLVGAAIAVVVLAVVVSKKKKS